MQVHGGSKVGGHCSFRILADQGNGPPGFLKVLEEDAPLRLTWADFYGQTEETVDAGSIEHYLTFARDYGLLDIAAH